MMAFGISAIGKVGPAYYPERARPSTNTTIHALDKGMLPVFRGIELNADDILRRADHPVADVPASSCRWTSIEIAHLIDFRSYFATELAALREMEGGWSAAHRSAADRRPAAGPHAGARHLDGL
jgi:oxygen-independent coproporphyrinogen-3 oxidase